MEDFVKRPNLPEGNVSLAVVDGRISSEIEKNLEKLGVRLIKTQKIKNACDSISFHPDIMLHHIGGREIIAAPNIPDKVVYDLEDEGFAIIMGKKQVEGRYPFDIPYNAARLGNFIVCSRKHTDEVLLEKLHEKGIKVIDVKQGYSKCSLCIISEDAVITSDRGMHNIFIEKNIQSKLITPGNIELYDMNYGFIGGASGKISEEKIVFYGKLQLHPDFNEINLFLLKHGKLSINLGENVLVDYGTLIPLKEYSILMP